MTKFLPKREYSAELPAKLHRELSQLGGARALAPPASLLSVTWIMHMMAGTPAPILTHATALRVEAMH